MVLGASIGRCNDESASTDGLQFDLLALFSCGD
jgi:hypothetical protein